MLIFLLGGGVATANFDGESDVDVMDESLMANTTSTFFPSGQNPNSYRRAPVMGNRGLEAATQRISQERSRSKPKSYSKDRASGGGSPRSGRRERRGGSASGSGSGSGSGVANPGLVQVAALDERNLKRAVHRYGTLPKGARIGAYLESLRQSGMTPEPVTEQGVESDATLDSSSQADTLERSIHSGRSSRDGIRPQAQMLRSNSSHGGFPAAANNHRSSPSPRTNPGQLRRLQNASYTEAELLNRGVAGAFALNDLEFPPPPADLPPPPDSPRRASNTPPPPPKPSPSPRTKRRVGPEFSNKENLPERLARSSRRNREASSDSCESGRSFEAGATSAAFHSQPKSPVSPLSENRTLGSPAVGSLSSPGSGLEQATGIGSSDAIRPYKKSDMELKLLNEIRERSESKKSPVKEAAPNRGATAAPAAIPVSGSGSNPAAMLVSELFESINAKKNKPPLPEKVDQAANSAPSSTVEIDFKANLRKVSKTVSDDAEKSKQSGQQIDFLSQLKKKSADAAKPEVDSEPKDKEEATNIVDFKSKLRKSKPESSFPPAQQHQEISEPLDFKARLRKVSDGSGNKLTQESKSHDSSLEAAESEKKAETPEPLLQDSEPDHEPQPHQLDKRDSVGSVEDNEKRKSTGSISSLRKMWESSPKIGGRKSAEEPTSDLSPDAGPSSAANAASSVKFEKRVWPPVPNTEMEKPMVPVKPTVKPPAPTTKPPPPKEPPSGVKIPPKPAMAVKPNVCNIYAAPSAPTTKSKPPISGAKPAKNGEASSEPDRDSLLMVSQKLESGLDAAKRDTSHLSKVELTNLSEEIGSFHSSCTGFIDSVPPTTRFRFRSLLTKLDQQSKEFSANLTSSGASGSTTSNRLAGDIQVTLRDLVTVIQR